MFIGIANFFKKFLLNFKVHQHLESDDWETKMMGGFLTVVLKKSVASSIPICFFQVRTIFMSPIPKCEGYKYFFRPFL
nr:hypothetical protein CFP56_75151 [Quercus suber]